MKIKKFCATATLLAAACAMQAGAMAADTPTAAATAGTATQSHRRDGGYSDQPDSQHRCGHRRAAAQRCADKLGRLAAEEDLRCG